MRYIAIAVLLGLATTTAQAEEARQPGAATALAVFAGGCFWCMEPPFDKIDGVLSTVSGYIGGSADNATYPRISTGRTGHYEALRVEYDPAKVDYRTLLGVFWRNVDPFDSRGQFCDKGPQYRTAIFALTDEQRKLAEESKARLISQTSGHGEIVTEILPPAVFHPAEAYHQDYYKKNAVRYKFYRWNCGRDRRLQQIWGKS
jgi:peptide-methionine (S)-S-oxide reductase